MIELLKKRFHDNMLRHPDIIWDIVEDRLRKNSHCIKILRKMEDSGGEPDTIGFFGSTDRLIFCDCSKESPSGRRSLCYDDEALKKRKNNPPLGNAVKMASEMGVELMNEEVYRRLQALGEFDLKTSSWIETPTEIRCRGGALFCERRYGTVFTFHNGADSYYSARGWRGYILV